MPRTKFRRFNAPAQKKPLLPKKSPYPQPTTIAEMRALMDRMAKHVGEYAGIPVTVKGQPIVVHPKYKFAKVFEEQRKKHHEHPEPGPDDWQQVRLWRSTVKKGAGCLIARKPNGKLTGGYVRMDNPLTMQFMTLGAAVVWDIASEARALEKLRSLVTEHAFNMYVLTGSFLETSKRSRVTYMFRRLRPTLAIRADDKECRCLCALCLHPIGYYEDTWAGAMVPTDELIAHLLLMRGDEHEYWKQANQHPAWTPNAGL